MKDKLKSAAKAPAGPARAKKAASKAEKPTAKSKTARVGVKKQTAETKARSAKTPKAATKKAAVKTRGTAARTRKKKLQPAEIPAVHHTSGLVIDPIGDTTDGEGRTYTGEAEVQDHAEPTNTEIEAFRRETQIEASDAVLEAGPGMEAAAEATEQWARSEAVETAEAAEQAGEEAEQRDPAKLERLQKILSQAGIASRRRAEEMITEGRVMVNGQVVNTLGSKADPERDHIRVDGKLLHGAERHRYFVLNKPRGYVTTVSDPEGRPTVMEFVAKTRERLYPVGRLDYQSEGLLLMTNDGELANLLTKAGSGVEKTYLVKVAGQPSKQELEKLRSGVEIERGEEGSGRVRTAPARVGQVREGDNPWFEVVLIEGRNRELRKMFAAVGHYVEKIRRVGYGPLTLDVEPGTLRELSPEEVTALRLTAEGKLKPRRLKADRMLPKEAGRAAEEREAAKRPRRDARPRREGGEFQRTEKAGFGGRREFGEKRGGKDFGQRERGSFGKREGGGFARRDKKPFEPRGEREQRKEWKPRDGEFRGKREGGERKGFDDRRGGERAGFGGRREGRPFGERRERPPFGGPKPRFERQGAEGRPRRERGSGSFEGEGRKPFRERGERPYFKRDAGPEQRRENRPERKFEKSAGKRWDRKPDERQTDGPRGEPREPRQAAPTFRGQGRKFGGGKLKPSFGGRPGGFGGPRREGGRGGSRPGGGRFGGPKRG